MCRSSRSASLLSTLIIGAVNVVSTLVALFGVDKFGRRTLFFEAGFQMFIAEVVIAAILGEHPIFSTVSVQQLHWSAQQQQPFALE